MAKTGVTRTIKKKTANKQPMRSGRTQKPPPFQRVTKRQIERVVDRWIEILDPLKIILFGSYAYGKPNADSDVGVLLIMERNERPTLRTVRALQAVRGVKNSPMDILVRTPKEIQERLDKGDFFFQEIMDRGKIMYERRGISWMGFQSGGKLSCRAPGKPAQEISGVRHNMFQRATVRRKIFESIVRQFVRKRLGLK